MRIYSTHQRKQNKIIWAIFWIDNKQLNTNNFAMDRVARPTFTSVYFCEIETLPFWHQFYEPAADVIDIMDMFCLLYALSTGWRKIDKQLNQ